jgi:hypothetical protein
VGAWGIAVIFVYVYIGTLLFYLWYIASVRLYGAWSGLDMQVKVFAGPSLVAFIVFDVLVNLLASLLFLDLPKEKLLTQRLMRYMAGPEGLRRRVATGICNKFLDPFDPAGSHC